MQTTVGIILLLCFVEVFSQQDVEVPGYRLLRNKRTTLQHSRKRKVLNVNECAAKCNKESDFVCGMFMYRNKMGNSKARCYLYDEIVKAKSTGSTWFKSATGYQVYEIIARNCIAKAKSTGVNYNGTKSVTKSGKSCQRWDSNFPHQTRFRPSNPQEHANYCRNPDFDRRGPWCYTTDPNVRYQFCDIPVCSEIPLTLEPKTITVKTECANCIGLEYRGKKRTTKSGNLCQRWDKTVPHNHTYNPHKYAEKNLAENFCRNPDGDLHPWCYTTDPSTRWEYCDIHRCNNSDGSPFIPPLHNPTSTCTSGNGDNYRGTKSTTISGRTCMRWSEQYPHTHTRTPTNYPCSGLDENNCRNPGGSFDEGIWCYTTDPLKRWEKCIVDDCNARQLPTKNCGKPEVTPFFNDQAFTIEENKLIPERKKRSITPQLRVLGGDIAVPGSWPWTVSMRYNGGHFCGGTIISGTWVITAAHCLDDGSSPKHLTVWAGHQYGGDQELQIRQAQKFILHKDYSPSPVANDLCLVELTRPFDMNARVMPACLPSSAYTIPPNTYCVATGWGRTLTSQDTHAYHPLKQLVVPVLSKTECVMSLGATLMYNTQMCAGWVGLGQDVCKGDSGGPLACKVGDYWTVQGVTSWGSSCESGGNVGAYVRVSRYLPWINKHTGIIF